MATGTTAEQIIDVVTPAAGESVTEGTILEWHVKVGDFIKVDATIVEISTDKVDVELPSPASGTVTELLVEEGDTVTVGQVIARIAVGDGQRPPARSGGGGGSGKRPTATAPAARATARRAPAQRRCARRPGRDATRAEHSASAGSTAAAGARTPADRRRLTPAAGESVTEGTILEWHVKVGEFIKADDDDRRDLDRQGRRRAACARQRNGHGAAGARRATR